MHFEIAHEFDAPLDAVELAVISPDLGAMLGQALHRPDGANGANGDGRRKPERSGFAPGIESVETIEHELVNGHLRRVLRFQASAPLALFRGHDVARDALAWEEVSTYRLGDHASTWTVLPKLEWRRFLRAEGTYRLEPVADGRTRRVITGDLEIKVAVLGPLAARMALHEIRKTYDAEAEALRRLATL